MKRKIISTILIIAGLLVLSYPKASEIYNNRQQKRIMKQWQESLAIIDDGYKEVPKEDSTEEESDISEENGNKKMEEYIKNNMDGILKIDKINLELPILKGATEKNMNISVASMDHTGKAGDFGNYVIAGHRNYTYGRNFNRLDEVEVGDIVEVDNGKNQYKYIVEEKLYVKPEETWVLNSNKKNKEITLITCHPMVNATHRLIIKGKIKDY